MALKSKFERIDQSKLKQGARDVLAKMKDKSENFTNAEVNKKIEPAIDKLIERLKKENPDALKKASATRTRKPKTTAKKKATKKAPAKTSGAKRETVMTVAKRIRKDGEKWQDALKRAKSEMGKDTQKKVSAVKTEVDKLKKLIETDSVLKGFANSELQRDAVRKAKPRGKRKTSTKGETTNQYGTFKNKVGRTYWESRENRSDRYAPKYPKNKPFLEMGGDVTDAQDLSIANADFLVMAKGGEMESKNYIVELRYIGLPIDESMIGKPIMSEETLDRLEDEFKYDVTFTPVDETKMKPLSYEDSRKFILDFDRNFKGLLMGYAKGGLVKKYKVGDMWSEDFDYEGMLMYGKKINDKTSMKDIEKYAESLQDVNYHTLAKPLFDYEVALSKDKDKKRYFLSNFKRKLSDELQNQGYGRLEMNEIYNFKKGGEIDAFTMSMVKGVDDGVSEIETKDLKARMEKGGEIASAIFNPNSKKGKISTSFGDKTKEGLTAMIENDSYSAKEIANAIFEYNEKRDRVETNYGDKTKEGLISMIESARDSKMAKGGDLERFRKTRQYDIYFDFTEFDKIDSSGRTQRRYEHPPLSYETTMKMLDEFKKQPKKYIVVESKKNDDGFIVYKKLKEDGRKKVMQFRASQRGLFAKGGFMENDTVLIQKFPSGFYMVYLFNDKYSVNNDYGTSFMKRFETLKEAKSFANKTAKENNATIKMAKGGRLKSALMRDRKYYNKNESWERAYNKGKSRRGYKENGGTIENSIQSYQNHYKGFPSYEDGGTITHSTQHFRIMETDTPIYKEGGQIDMDL